MGTESAQIADIGLDAAAVISLALSLETCENNADDNS